MEKEKREKIVEFSQPTEYDYRKWADSLDPLATGLDGKVKVTVRDEDGHTAVRFVDKDVVKRLGKEYIRSHITVYYNTKLCGWFAKLSQNDYYNDPDRNPERIVRVKYVGKTDTDREVYKGVETGRYYLRENCYPRETFAKWYVCGKTLKAEDGNEPRANLVFECDDQQEKVRYDDWNGVAAYGDTFNKDFGVAE